MLQALCVLVLYKIKTLKKALNQDRYSKNTLTLRIYYILFMKPTITHSPMISS